ncbi:MAG: 30S ribosomal protein S9, partial [Gemmataceae bacterium]
MAEKKTFYTGTGRRKTAVARVRLTDGKGTVMINGRPLERYFTEEKDRLAVVGPLLATEMLNRIDVTVKTHGGGITGQADAIKQGIARAVKTMFAPPAERKVFTFGNVTMVRAFKDPKAAPVPVAAPATPTATVATATPGAAPAA